MDKRTILVELNGFEKRVSANQMHDGLCAEGAVYSQEAGIKSEVRGQADILGFVTVYFLFSLPLYGMSQSSFVE